MGILYVPGQISSWFNIRDSVGFEFNGYFPDNVTHQFQSDNINKILQNDLIGRYYPQKRYQTVYLIRIRDNLQKTNHHTDYYIHTINERSASKPYRPKLILSRLHGKRYLKFEKPFEILKFFSFPQIL